MEGAKGEVWAVHLGDLPTWLIFVATAGAAFFAYRAFRAEQRQRQALTDDAVEAQARAVAAWIEYEEFEVDPSGPLSAIWEPRRGRVLTAKVKNASGLPVYRCRLVFESGQANGGELGAIKAPAVLAPGETQSVDPRQKRSSRTTRTSTRWSRSSSLTPPGAVGTGTQAEPSSASRIDGDARGP